MAGRKTYAAEISFGAATTTDDAEGEILRTAAIPELHETGVAECLKGFTGEIEQIPPRYSAIKQQGRRAYSRSRAGEEVNLAPRPVTIYSFRVERWAPPRLRVVVETGPGTYIRSLARDIGERVNSAAYLHSLVRVQSGSFSIRDAVPLAALEKDGVLQYMQATDSAVRSLPAILLNGPDTQRSRHGSTLELSGKADTLGASGSLGEISRLYGSSGEFIGLARSTPEGWHPFKVLEPAA
jgi:tRNA pseudouridine55 synthase